MSAFLSQLAVASSVQAVAADELFQQEGQWIKSSPGFARWDVSASVRRVLDSAVLATERFVLDTDGIPEAMREQLLDEVTRVWKWAGLAEERIGR